MPGLHLLLGIFNRLFNLLEAACQTLDIQLAAMDSATGMGGTSFQQYAAVLKQLLQLKEQHTAQTARRNFQSQLLSFLHVRVPSPQQSQTVQHVQQEIAQPQQQLSVLVNRLKILHPHTCMFYFSCTVIPHR